MIKGEKFCEEVQHSRYQTSLKAAKGERLCEPSWFDLAMPSVFSLGALLIVRNFVKSYKVQAAFRRGFKGE